MKKESVEKIISQSNSLMNDVVLGTVGILEGVELVWKLDDLLHERGINQKQLAEMTGMRVGTISNWVNGKQGVGINKVQLLAIMSALRVTSISDIVDIKFPKDLLLKFEKQKAEWILEKEMPLEVKEMYRENLLKSNNLEDKK